MADQLLYSQSMPKTDRGGLSEYPTLSLKERERRWGLVRKMMAQNNLEALISIPGGAWDDPSNYLTNYLWPRHGITVFFPLQGEPVAFGVFHLLAVDSLLKSESYGIDSWVRDWRYAQGTPENWVALLKERGLVRGRIGIAANGHFSRAIQLLVANALMSAIREALPDVSFVDVWDQLVDIWIVKDAEEIAMFRKAALATEVASEEFVLACRPGNTVADVQNAFMSALLPYGIDIWRSEVSSEPDGGRGILWMGNGIKPPVIRKGHLVCTEFFVYAGSLHAQAQITVSVGEPSAEKKKLAAVARECYEIGLKTLRPGIPFAMLAEALGEPLKREGLWHLSPLAHTMNPHAGVTNVTEGIRGPVGFTGANERFGNVKLPEHGIERPDLLIREGMVLQFEPNACKGRTYVNIGGNVLVTKDGCEELNRIPTWMVVAPA
jgi:Xaa-Pro aminopeptidase